MLKERGDKELLKLAYQTETGLEKLDQHGRSVGEKSSVITYASRKRLSSKEPWTKNEIWLVCFYSLNFQALLGPVCWQ